MTLRKLLYFSCSLRWVVLAVHFHTFSISYFHISIFPHLYPGCLISTFPHFHISTFSIELLTFWKDSCRRNSSEVLLLPSWLHPGGPKRYPVFSFQLMSDRERSLQMASHSWKIIDTGVVFSSGLVSPYWIGWYSSACNSSWKVPKILSQMMRNMPMFLSRYFGLDAWWTLWWLGVTNICSSQPILLMSWVWTNIPQIWVAEYTKTISSGLNPSQASGRK